MHRLRVLTGIPLVVVACGLTPVADRPPVPAGPLGPIVPGPAGGAPVECRGVPIEQCTSFANQGEADVVRYIITCTAVCTPQQGSVRIDILSSNGTTRSAGDGQYVASAPVPAPAVPEASSEPGPS